MPISKDNQTNWFKKDYQYLKVAPEGMKNLTVADVDNGGGEGVGEIPN